MALSKKLLHILACPVCKVPVKLKKSKSKESLVCTKCKRLFEIRNGIPIMMQS